MKTISRLIQLKKGKYMHTSSKKSLKFKHKSEDMWDLITDPDYLVMLLSKDAKVIDSFLDVK